MGGVGPIDYNITQGGGDSLKTHKDDYVIHGQPLPTLFLHHCSCRYHYKYQCQYYKRYHQTRLDLSVQVDTEDSEPRVRILSAYEQFFFYLKSLCYINKKNEIMTTRQLFLKDYGHLFLPVVVSHTILPTSPLYKIGPHQLLHSKYSIIQSFGIRFRIPPGVSWWIRDLKNKIKWI